MSTTWISALSNPEALDGRSIPDLGDVRLSGLRHDRGIGEFEVSFSTKPISSGESEMRFTLEFSSDLMVDLATVNKWGDFVDVGGTLEKHGDGVITFDCKGAGVDIRIECKKVNVRVTRSAADAAFEGVGIDAN